MRGFFAGCWYRGLKARIDACHHIFFAFRIMVSLREHLLRVRIERGVQCR